MAGSDRRGRRRSGCRRARRRRGRRGGRGRASRSASSGSSAGEAAAGGLRGGDDRLVAGAAAEVALQRLLDLGTGRLRLAHPERVERHHEARRAEAALAAVQLDHRRLDRVQRPAAGDVLDGDDVAEVDRGEQPDAGVDRLVDQPAGAYAGRPARCRRRSRPRRSPPWCRAAGGPAAGGRAACRTTGRAASRSSRSLSRKRTSLRVSVNVMPPSTPSDSGFPPHRNRDQRHTHKY